MVVNEKGGAVGVFGNSSSFASSVLDESTNILFHSIFFGVWFDPILTGTGLNSRWVGACFGKGASLCISLLCSPVSSSMRSSVSATLSTSSQFQCSVIIFNGSESSSISRSASSGSSSSLHVATLSSNLVVYNKLRSRVYVNPSAQS